MAKEDRKQEIGEGDRESARHYNEQTQEHVKQHDVEKEAREADPKDESQREEMEKAEREGKEHAKERDPSVHRDYKKPE